MYKQYLLKSLLLFTFIMFLIAGINFIVDPGKIYLKKIIADLKSAEFSDKLFSSKNGIIQTGWNERLVKTTLAKKSGNFDCIILGSSHIMQISSIRNTGNINKQCKKLLNLGVSGGSIEDIAIFSYLIMNNIKLPKQVFIDIDPWTLKFGMDSRYGAYKSYYTKMNELLQNKDSNYESYLSKGIKNLFNGEYFYYSIKELMKKENKKKSMFDKQILYPINEFSYSSGYKEAVTLVDGSHIYKNSWILKQKNNISSIKIGGGGYKIKGSIYSKSTLDYFQKLVNLYKYNNINVNLILTPYHPNVFKKGNTKPVKHFKEIEKVVNSFVKKNNLKVYGSFFPNKLGCKNHEFFDFMHSTNQCLNRIDFSE